MAVGTVVTSYAAASPNGIAWANGRLFYAGAEVYEINPDTGASVATLNVARGNLRGLTWDGANLWVASQDSSPGFLVKLNASGGAVAEYRTPGGQPRGLAWDGSYLWHADGDTGMVYRLSTTGTVVSSFTAPTPLWGLTFVAGYLWAATIDGRLVKLNGAGAILESHPLTVNPFGVTADGSGERFWLTDASAGTITVVEGPNFNQPPKAPTPLSPLGDTVDRSQPITLSAQFNDPNPDDSPSASEWRYKATAATTWTTVNQPNPLQSYTIPAGLAAGDYEWQARYADQQGEWGPFCPSAFFTAADPVPGPVWLDPLNGATIPTSSYEGVISAADVDESEWTLYADNAGAPGAILAGPVRETTGDLRRHTFDGLVNNTTVWWGARTKFEGLWSPEVRISTPVSYTPPPAPTVTVDNTTTAGAIRVRATAPEPSGAEPAVTHVDIYRREGTDTAGIRRAATIAPGVVWDDHFVASGVDYDYRVKAYGDNGTYSWSAWSGEPEVIYEELDGGSPSETGGETLDGGSI